MTPQINRRELLTGVVGTALVASAGSAEAAQDNSRILPKDGPKKALIFDMLPRAMSVEDRFKLAKDCGFDAVESSPIADRAECERMRKGAEAAGMRVHSVIYGGWDPPLSHPDPAAREKSVKNAVAALESAHAMGADNILLVPAVVNAQTRYVDAYQRSREGIKKLIPTAERLKTLICVEEVWNNFLLSPMEFAAYVDSFKNPWVQAYFDVGNVVAFAWPQDWVRTLGTRIKKVHIKDYKGGPGLFGSRNGNFVNIRDGSIDWPEVRKAFAEIGYTGYMTLELGGGDAAYLKDLGQRFDKIMAGV